MLFHVKRLEKKPDILNAIASSKEILRFASDVSGGVGGLVCNNLDALAAISCAIYKEIGGLFFAIVESREICEQKHMSFDSFLGGDLNLLVAPQKKDTDLSGFLSFGEKSFDVNDLTRINEEGKGYINILRLTDIQDTG